MVWPAYLSNSFINLLDNAFLLLALLFLFLHRYKPSKMILLISVYYFYLIVISFINHSSAADVHLVISNVKIILYLAVFDSLISIDNKDVVNTLFYIFFTIVLIDFIIVVLYPNGWYFEEVVYNEWTTGYGAMWFLGNKNNHTMFYFITIYLAVIRYSNNKSFFNKMIASITVLMAIIAMYILDSATSLFITILISIGAILAVVVRKFNYKAPNIYPILVIYAILVMIVLTGLTSFLTPILSGLFNRDMTFTGRTDAWLRVWEFIKLNPIFGYGAQSAEVASESLGALAYANAHNQYLQLLWEGGIILLCIFIYIVLYVSKQINLERDSKIKLLKITFFFSILIKFIFEVEINLNVWMIFMLIYRSNFCSNNCYQKGISRRTIK